MKEINEKSYKPYFKTTNHLVVAFLMLMGTFAHAQTYEAPGTYGGVEIGEDVEETIGGSGEVTFASLEVQEGAVLTIPEGVTLIIDGTFENVGGTVVVNGELILNGDGNENKSSGTITGSGTMTAPDGIENTGGATIFGSTEENPDCTSGCSESTLPVELLYFKGETAGHVIISWATGSEDNNDHFSIERSEDGSYFYEIGRIAGQGTTKDITEYRYTDKLVMTPVAYYRLKQVDYDGRSTNFKIIRVETRASGEPKQLRVAHHYATGTIQIRANRSFEVKDLCISNLSGKKIPLRQNVAGITGQQVVSFNIAHFPKGIYLLKLITSDGEQTHHKFVVK